MAIMQLLPPKISRITSGEIHYMGTNLRNLSQQDMQAYRGKEIAMIFQEPMTALNPVFSIGSQMVEVIRLHLGLSKAKAREHAVQYLEDVGLDEAQHLLNQYPDSLSGGMRQRVLIAMAMSLHPECIIADEPTTALDVSVQKRIIALLRKLQQEKNLGMLLVTHDFGLVAEMCDDVAVMYAGQIVEYGPVSEIFNHPAHPYTRALMGCRPEVSEIGRALPVIKGQVPQPGQWPQGCHFSKRCPLSQDDCNQNALAANVWQHEKHIARCLHVTPKHEADKKT